MSKKNEVHSSPHANSAAASADSATAAQLVARYNSEAALSAAADVRLTFKPRVLARVAKKIAAIPKKNPKLYAALVEGKFNVAQLEAIGTLGLALTAALKPTPPNRARTKLITPAQKQTVKDAGARLGKAIEAAQSVGRALRRLEDVKPLGRASDVGDSPESVQTAIEVFQSNAPGVLDLLDDAGVDEEYRASIGRDLAAVEAISDVKEEKAQEKLDAGKSILEAALAVEIAFFFFRGRVNSRLQADPASQAKALKYLPRRPEQRKKPEDGSDEDEKSEDDKDGEETDEEGGEEAGGKDGEKAATDGAGAAEAAKKDAAGKGKPAAK